MGRMLLALAVVAILASCGSGSNSPPRNLDNACSILKQRPQYRRAFRATERKWQVPTHVQMAIIYQESRFRRNARTPRRWFLGVIPRGRQSSAYGYAQALDGTWDEYRREEGGWRASRTDIRDAADFIGWYAGKSRKRNGIAPDDARNLYLAYHEGHGGYARGTYRNKAWLVNVAGSVQRRANTYQGQLRRCSR